MKKILILAAILLAVGAGWKWGLPAYRGYKERTFAAQAREHLASGEFRPALLSAQQALALNPTNLTACQVMADLADAGRSANAVIWRRRIVEIEPTLSNLVMLASCALRYEQPPFVIAQSALASAAKTADTRNSVLFQVVSAQLALKQGRVPDAEKAFETAIRLEPTNRLHRLNLATVRLESRDTAVSAAAHAELAGMQNDPQIGDHALRSLAAHHASRKDLEGALKYSTALIERKGASFDDRLAHLNWLHQAKRPDFDGYLARLAALASTNATMVFGLANQLLASGETQKALQWLKSLPVAMQTEQPVPMAFADALARLKDWRGMEERLSSERWKDQDFMRLALMSYAVRNQNDATVSKAHWDKAVHLAGDRPERMALLAQMAANWRWDAEADELLWRVVKNFPRENWAVETLHNAYVRTRNTRGLLAVYGTLLDREPTNSIVMNNYASIAMLLKTNLSRAHQLSKHVYQSGTNNFIYASTYAWSLYLQGKPREALQMMETLSTAHLADPTISAYYGTLLVANGQKEKARPVLERAAKASLLPEEKAMVEESQRKL